MSLFNILHVLKKVKTVEILILEMKKAIKESTSLSIVFYIFKYLRLFIFITLHNFTLSKLIYIFASS